MILPIGILYQESESITQRNKIESRKLLYAFRPLNTNEREEELNRERGTGNTRGRGSKN